MKYNTIRTECNDMEIQVQYNLGSTDIKWVDNSVSCTPLKELSKPKTAVSD